MESADRGIADSGSLAINHHDRHTWRSGVRSAMCAASQLPGRGPLMWRLPLYLHVNQKSDDDDDVCLNLYPTSKMTSVVTVPYLLTQQLRRFFQSKSIDIYLISPRKHMLWVLIRRPWQDASNECHNICFHGEIRKIFTGYPPLSRPM